MEISLPKSDKELLISMTCLNVWFTFKIFFLLFLCILVLSERQLGCIWTDNLSKFCSFVLWRCCWHCRICLLLCVILYSWVGSHGFFFTGIWWTVFLFNFWGLTLIGKEIRKHHPILTMKFENYSYRHWCM